MGFTTGSQISRLRPECNCEVPLEQLRTPPIIIARMTLNRLALLPPLLALGAAPRAPFRLEELLPETTLVFAEVPSAPAFRESFRKTPLAKLLDDEEVRAFLGQAIDSAA